MHYYWGACREALLAGREQIPVIMRCAESAGSGETSGFLGRKLTIRILEGWACRNLTNIDYAAEWNVKCAED